MSELKTLLEQLRDIASSPSAQLDKTISEGKKAIGCMPVYCPEEIVYAAGMIPFGVWGADGVELKNSKLYFPAFICSVLQSTIELGMAGVYNKLSGIMIPVLCDSLKCMTQNFRCAVPQVEVIPVIHPQNRRVESGQEFLRSQYNRIRAKLGEIAGVEITDEKLNTAIDIYNAHRASMRSFVKAASEHPDLISPRDRSAVIKSGYFMDKAEHSKIVDEINGILTSASPCDKKFKRVIVTGILADSPAILEAFERFGMAIVGDDVAAESRQFRTDVPAGSDPIERLAKQFADMEGCSVLFDPEKKRPELIVSLAQQSKADGVVTLLTKFCDPEEFDWPFLKAAFAKANLPATVIEIDRQMTNFGQLETALEAFADLL